MPTTQKMLPDLLSSLEKMETNEMEEYLRVADRNMEKELNQIKLKYEEKKDPIVANIQLKEEQVSKKRELS